MISPKHFIHCSICPCWINQREYLALINLMHSNSLWDTLTTMYRFFFFYLSSYCNIFIGTFLLMVPKSYSSICLVHLTGHCHSTDAFPVGWGCRIHRLLIFTGVRPPPTSVLDMKLNNLIVGFKLILELWGMQSTPSLPLLPDPLWLGTVAPDRVLSMG